MWSWFTKATANGKPKTLGQIGEELAQAEYKKRGLKIVAANFFNKKGLRLGEIDFIASDKHTVIFVEVKTRADNKGLFGTGAEAVDHFKQAKLLRAVKIFLQKRPEYQNFRPQIDVCLILISDFSSLKSVQTRPAKYLIASGLDKIPHSVTIIPNAVEDWN